MTAERDQTERLDELRRQWKADRSFRLCTQLAEECRRAGRLEEAVTVLEEGLRHHPHQLSARVALGRCRLELGEPETARGILEQVVAEDPEQLVALKLLAEVHLALGDGVAARRQLDLYRALNPQDPDTEALEARAEGLSRRATVALSVESAAVDTWRTASGRHQPRSGDPIPGLWKAGDDARLVRELADGVFGPLVVPAPAGVAALVDSGAGGLASAAATEAAPIPAEESPGPPATVTLGVLYLEQGHVREAARIFSRVLGGDPGNEAARRGLAAAEAKLHHQATEPSTRRPPTARERKIVVLRAYLERIRAARGRSL